MELEEVHNHMATRFVSYLSLQSINCGPPGRVNIGEHWGDSWWKVRNREKEAEVDLDKADLANLAVVNTFSFEDTTLIGNYLCTIQLARCWLQMTSNTVASVSVGLVSAESSVLAVVAHTIIGVDLTPGVKLVFRCATCCQSYFFFHQIIKINQVRLEHMWVNLFLLLISTLHPPILEHKCRTPWMKE